MKDGYFFCPFLKRGDNILCFEESQHIARVMRYKLGDRITLFNGKGLIGEARIDSLSKKKDEVIASVFELVQVQKKSPSLRVYFSPPKGKLYHFLLRQLASLGVDEIIPVQYDRSVRLNQSDKKLLEKNFIVACKQSHNPFFPKLSKRVKFFDALSQAQGDIFFGSLSEKTKKNKKKGSIISLFIGPEGDFSSYEEKLLLEKAYPIQLNSYILKIETACVALLAQFL